MNAKLQQSLRSHRRRMEAIENDAEQRLDAMIERSREMTARSLTDPSGSLEQAREESLAALKELADGAVDAARTAK